MAVIERSLRLPDLPFAAFAARAKRLGYERIRAGDDGTIRARGGSPLALHPEQFPHKAIASTEPDGAVRLSLRGRTLPWGRRDAGRCMDRIVTRWRGGETEKHPRLLRPAAARCTGMLAAIVACILLWWGTGTALAIRAEVDFASGRLDPWYRTAPFLADLHAGRLGPPAGAGLMLALVAGVGTAAILGGWLWIAERRAFAAIITRTGLLWLGLLIALLVLGIWPRRGSTAAPSEIWIPSLEPTSLWTPEVFATLLAAPAIAYLAFTLGLRLSPPPEERA